MFVEIAAVPQESEMSVKLASYLGGLIDKEKKFRFWRFSL